MTRKRALIAAVALTAISAGPALAAWPYDAIISFGDSLSDVGNVFGASGGAEPASPYYEGRFSDGPIWLDDLAAMMHLAPLKPSGITGTGGTDFAWGGATTGLPETMNADGVPTLVEQVALFSAVSGGHAPSNALYTFSIGANDLTSAIDGVLGGTVTDSQAGTYAIDAADVAAGQAAVLKGEGATDLVVFDVPDLSKTPAVLEAAAQLPSADAAEFLAFVEGLSAAFDTELFKDLGKLEQGTDFKVYDLDVFGLIDTVVADPSAPPYDFSNATDPCYVGAFTGGGSVCGDPNDYLFWDNMHPTAKAGGFIALDAFRAVVPEPSSWAMMAIGFSVLGLAGTRWRRAGPQAA